MRMLLLVLVALFAGNAAHAAVTYHWCDIDERCSSTGACGGECPNGSCIYDGNCVVGGGGGVKPFCTTTESSLNLCYDKDTGLYSDPMEEECSDYGEEQAGTWVKEELMSCSECNDYGGTLECCADNDCAIYSCNCNAGYSVESQNTEYCLCVFTGCPAGQYLNGNTCTPCPNGTYKSGTNSATSCTSCPPVPLGLPSIGPNLISGGVGSNSPRTAQSNCYLSGKFWVTSGEYEINGTSCTYQGGSFGLGN